MARPKTNLTYEEKVTALEAKINEAEEAAKKAKEDLATLREEHRMEQAKELAKLLECSAKTVEDVRNFILS